ncbi:MAG: hypothetical protein Q8M38_08850 [Phenylobacterium sp.]|nr:hypothetical protein [Phenylobacterium sp.]
MNSGVQYPGPNDFADIEASANRLAAKGLSTPAAYAFAVIVKRSRDEDFDAHLARDELRRVGYPASQADAIVHEVCLWRTAAGLGKKRHLTVALARPMSLLFG